MNLHRNRALVTYEEIGRRLHISPGRVRQLEISALSKMRKGLEKMGVSAATISGEEDLPKNFGGVMPFRQ